VPALMPNTVKHPLQGREAYAPAVAIKVGSKELSGPDTADIIDLRVTLEKDQLGGFSITLANAEPRYELRAKDRQTATSLFKYSDSGLFELGAEIQISMGYAGQVKPILLGQISTLTPSFPQSGLPTLTVGGADRLTFLRRKKPGTGVSKAFKQRMDWQIAQEIAERNNLDFNATTTATTKHPIVMQKDKDYLDFLLERAKTVGYDVYMDVNPDTGKDRLNFIKPLDASDSRPVNEFTYDWGVALRSFSTSVTETRQVSAVTVRGWDPRTKQKLEATATTSDLPDTPGDGQAGPESASDKTDIIVDMRVASVAEARMRAIAMLERKAYLFVTGHGEVMGDPDLRPGSIVNLGKLGDTFSGSYTVKKTEHVFGSGGYTTSFEVERMRLNAKPKGTST